MSKRIKVSRLSLKLIGIVVVAAIISVLTFWLLFLNRYRVFYIFHNQEGLKKQTTQEIDKLQKSIRDKHISKKDGKAIQKELHKFKGYTIYLYDAMSDFDGEYYTSSLESQAYLQTTSLLVRLYDPIPQELEIEFYDGTSVIEVFSYQGVAFMLRYMLAVCLFVIVLFISIIMVYVHRKMRYVLEIGEEMKRIENGDFHHTIIYKGSDEITDLAKQLNHLRSVLYENMANEEDARKANEELVTAMSHDLRTPLTSLMGYLDIVDMKIYKGDEERDNYIKKSKDKAEQIKELSDRLFNHFLVYAQRDEVILETFTCEDVTTVLRIFCDELKELHFKVDEVIDTHPFLIRVDRKLLERISINLYSNIYKYADKEIILVSLTMHQGQVLLKVKNLKKKNIKKEESTHIGVKSIQKMMKDMGGNVVIDEDYEFYCITLIFPSREDNEKNFSMTK